MCLLILVHDSFGVRLNVLPGFMSIRAPAPDLLASKTAARSSDFRRGSCWCQWKGDKCDVEQHDGDFCLGLTWCLLSRSNFYFMRRTFDASYNTWSVGYYDCLSRFYRQLVLQTSGLPISVTNKWVADMDVINLRVTNKWVTNKKYRSIMNKWVTNKIAVLQTSGGLQTSMMT